MYGDYMEQGWFYGQGARGKMNICDVIFETIRVNRSIMSRINCFMWYLLRGVTVLISGDGMEPSIFKWSEDEG